MSGYFARLALRSGALPFAPRPSSFVQAAGIVEQENVLEVSASSPVGVDGPTGVPTLSGERTANAIPSPVQSTAAAVDTASSAPSVMRADASARASARMPGAGQGEPMTVPAPPTLNASSVHEASSGAASVAAPSSGPTQRAEHGPHENGVSTLAPRLDVIDDRPEVVPPGAVAPRSEGRTNRGERALSRPPVVSHEVTSAHPSAQPGSETRAQAAAGRTTTSSSRAAPAQNIDVHIGAVRLEIHGQPAPASTPVAASAPARTEERPRFAPRRYYLRG